MLLYNQTQLYLEDWIGLKTLDEAGKVDFLSSPGVHLQISDEFFKEIVTKYLKWFDLIWFDMIWYDMIWYDLIW